MISRKYETIVGIFVVASLVALLIMVVIIARQEGLFQDYVEYQAIFKNVSGLKAGSEVHLAGVTVGNVKDITINPEGNSVVTFNVLQKYSDKIRQDSRASIGYMGLLGEKSLDLTAGSQNLAAIPPEGMVASVEPLDITQLLAGAGPSLENVQKILNNLVSVTDSLRQPDSDLRKTLYEVREIVTKINQGKGSLGLLINDPALYKETTQTVTAARKFMIDMEQGKGLLGTLIVDPKFKTQAEQTLTELQATFANLSKATTDLKEVTARLPEMSKKLEAFLTNLNQAGKGLPGLVTEGENLVGDMDKTTKAAQKSWLLRKHVPTPKEHTIRMDAEPRKD